MRITDITIENFRGIRTCSISFPNTNRLVCMIGAGDSTKSTIMKAVEWVLWPSWSLPVGDSDFYKGKTGDTITIIATFTEVPVELLSENKFGFYLRREGVLFQIGLDDEPVDGLPLCLSVRLTIDSQLEPTWEVVNNRSEPKPINYNDRRKMQLGVIGNEFEKDLTWGRYSILQKYADSKGAVQQAYASTLREALKLTKFESLDKISDTIKEIGQKFGVELVENITNRMIVQSGLYLSSVGVFEGESPLNQRGNGSRRLLSIGLNLTAFDGSTLLLIDEVEAALEPYRIRSLINELRDQLATSGQAIITTHSPVVVAECTLDEIIIVQSKKGETKSYTLSTQDESANNAIQAEVRRNPESFLCKRIIVCEGKTEIGFIRAMDKVISKTKKFRMAYKGVSVAFGSGSTTHKCAETLSTCGYDTCVFVDSDRKEDYEKNKSLEESGIPVFQWEEGKAIEEQVFCDVPAALADELISVAVRYHGIDAIKSHLEKVGIDCTTIGAQISLVNIGKDVIARIGTIAKRNNWYKQIGSGEAMANVVFQSWSNIDETSYLKVVVNGLTKWIEGND